MTRGFSFMGAVAALVVVIVVALAAAFFLRDLRNPTAAASPTPAAVATTAAPSPTASAAVTQTTAPTASAAPGAISGLFGYPAGSIPALTTYAISVADPGVFFWVSTPRWAEGSTAPPGTGTPPGGYIITVIAPGSYYVVSYRDSDPTGPPDRPGLYSQWSLCTRPPNTNWGNCTDHTLIPVTVQPGATVSGVDIADWFNFGATVTYPPRPTR